MNKRGQTNLANVVLFGIIILVIMGAGLILAFGGVIAKNAISNIVPGFNSLSTLGGLDKVSTGTRMITTMSNSIPIVSGVIYMLALISILGLAFAFRVTGEKYLIVPFILVSLLVIFGSIFISNVYEDAYRGGGVMGAGLQEMTLLSWLMIYSPIIMTVIVFIGGAIMFSGFDEVSA